MSEQQVSIETANALYQEGGDYFKHRTLVILKEELARHRKGSSGHATVEMLLNKVLELQVVT
jgi:hypothetical protein